LGDETFLEKIKQSWKPFENSSLESTPIQFHQNLKIEKQVAIKWSKDKRKNDEKLLVDIEAQLENCYLGEGHGFLTITKKMKLSCLRTSRGKFY
jgi:hypothetical protein